MTDDEGGLRWLRVHVRRSVEPGGVTALSRTVFCPSREARVSVDDCSSCGKRFAIDRRDRDVFLVCDVPAHALVPPTEMVPDPAGVSPSGETVADIMTSDVVTVTPELSVHDLLQAFLERGISGAPVLRDGKPVGMVSKTDVVRALHGSTAPRTIEVIGRTGEAYAVTTSGMPGLNEACVSDIMTQLTLVLHSATPIERAAAVMAYEGVHRVPVVSDAEEVIGLVTSLDILRSIARRAGYVVPARTALQR